MSWRQWADGELERIRQADRWRRPRDLDRKGPAGTLVEDGRAIIEFASNDYLGLSSHPAVIAAAHEALDRWGTGSGAARLVVGSRPVHTVLEAELADWKGSERAVLFPTGYMANLAVLATLAGPDTSVFSDEMNHASIIDGCRLSRASTAVYRHGDLEHLEALLAQAPGRRLVATDSVFSMDGDRAPIAGLIALCRRFDALLVLDEAHAVLGPHLPRPAEAEVIQVGTLSKSLGTLGGFVAGDAALMELLVNRARPYIFTTAPTPADTAAALAALRILRSDEGADLHDRLRSHVEVIRPGHPSPIVPIILGTELAALEASATLLEEGLLVPAIRPPTVPAGTSRLRVTLSAAHRHPDVVRLGRVLQGITAAVPV